MSIEQSIILTPVKADIVPSAKNIVRLLQWFDEKDDFEKKISAENPLEVTYHLEEEDEEEVTFPALDTNLENYLATHQDWHITCSTPGLTTDSTQGYVTQLLHINSPDYDGYYLLDSISLYCKDIRSWFDVTDMPDRNFAVAFCTLDDGEVDGGDYFELASESLISSGVLAEIANILGIELELHEAWC